MLRRGELGLVGKLRAVPDADDNDGAEVLVDDVEEPVGLDDGLAQRQKRELADLRAAEREGPEPAERSVDVLDHAVCGKRVFLTKDGQDLVIARGRSDREEDLHRERRPYLARIRACTTSESSTRPSRAWAMPSSSDARTCSRVAGAVGMGGGISSAARGAVDVTRALGADAPCPSGALAMRGSADMSDLRNRPGDSAGPGATLASPVLRGQAIAARRHRRDITEKSTDGGR